MCVLQYKKDLTELVFSTTVDSNLPELAERVKNFTKELSNHMSLVFNVHLLSLHQLNYLSKVFSANKELFSSFEFWITLDISRISIPILARDIFDTPIPETICPSKREYAKELLNHATRFLIHTLKENAHLNSQTTRLLFNWQSYPAIYATSSSNNFSLSASCFCDSCKKEMKKYNIDRKTILHILKRTNRKINMLWVSVKRDTETLSQKDFVGDEKEIVSSSDIHVSDLKDSDIEIIDDVEIEDTVELDTPLTESSPSEPIKEPKNDKTDIMYTLTYGHIPLAAVEYIYGNIKNIYSKLLKSPEVKLWVKFHAIKSWSHNVALYHHFEEIINSESINAVAGLSFEALLPYPHFHTFQLHPLSLGINYKKIKSYFAYKKMIFELPTAKILFAKRQLKVLNTTVGTSDSKICHYSPAWIDECLIDSTIFALQGSGSLMVPAQNPAILNLVLDVLPKIL